MIMMDEASDLFLANIVKQCRELALLPNERTTILSHAEELQLLQYCMALQNEKEGKEFEVDPSEAVAVLDKTNHQSIHQLEQTISAFQKQENNGEENSTDHVSVEKSLEIVGTETTDKEHGSESQALVDDGELHTDSLSTIMSDMNIDTSSVSETMIEALSLFKEYKNTSNHFSAMDVFTKFTEALLDSKSDIHQSLTSERKEDHQELLERLISVLKEMYRIDSMSHSQTDVTAPKTSTENSEMPSTLTTDSPAHLPPRTPSTKDAGRAFDSQLTSPTMSSATPKTPISQSHRKELQILFVRDLFRSYLHLLVNSRSQLALSRVFNIPERGLDHEAFTHLKHEAAKCGLSMYQTLSSVMLRIHLGGKGYAPETDNPLLMYVKGLGSLLDMSQKLQTIVEEVPDISSACRRVVNLIKNSLIQCKSGKFTRSLVQPVSEEIHKTLASIIQENEAHAKDSPDKAVSSGGSVLGRKCLRVIHQYLDRSALAVSTLDHQLLSDIRFSAHTPTRFPCLLTQFRSPAIMESDETIASSIQDNMEGSPLSRRKGTHTYFVSSALYMDDDASNGPLLTQGTMKTIEVLPSKTIVHPRVNADDIQNQQFNVVVTRDDSDVVKNKGKRKGGKRCTTACNDKENLTASPATVDATVPKRKKLGKKDSETTAMEASPKTSKKRSKQNNKEAESGKASKSCRRRLLPQVKGQAKITGFFRV